MIKSLIGRIVITAPDPIRAKANGARFDYEQAEIQWARWGKDGSRIPRPRLKSERNEPGHAKRK